MDLLNKNWQHQKKEVALFLTGLVLLAPMQLILSAKEFHYQQPYLSFALPYQLNFNIKNNSSIILGLNSC